MLERLAIDASKSLYYEKLYKKVVSCFCLNNIYKSGIELTKKELRDILRFADIFSNSKDEAMRNKAYRIVSLLYDKYKDNSIYRMYSNAVLKKINNFPALNKIEGFELPFERQAEYLFHKVKFKSPIGETYFLPNQYEIYNYMKDNYSLTFSGPTSMGKSFIIKQFIISRVNNNIDANFCIIVPTRALIKQYVVDFNKELNNYSKMSKYKVLTNANILEYLKIDESNYIFVLTQERLNVLLYSRHNINIDYLFIDEAHKVFAEDTRALTLYSSIDACLMRNNDIKVFFSSPLVQNPEIFKEVYKKTDLVNYKSNESPVTQNLFFIDLNNKRIEFIEDGESIWLTEWKNYYKSREDLFYKLGEGKGNIIYLSSKDKVIEYSIVFIKYLKKKEIELLNENEKKNVEEVCTIIEKNIHKDYNLISCLKCGVAYHNGRMPTIIKESIEELYKKGIIKYMFCTSTLLEGVNLPAKNIFIMANYKGNSKMKAIDFWNLAGRSGRLGFEYYGNVYCVNDYTLKRAWNDKTVFKEKYNIKLKDTLGEKIKKEKTNIKEIISSIEPFEESGKKNKYNSYLSNIIQIESMSNDGTLIVEKVEKIDKEIIELCPERDEYINYDIINSSKSIDYKIQSSIMKDEEVIGMSNTINYTNCKEMLKFMYKKYRWDIKEENLKNEKSLDYFARLMALWINGKPLNEIISQSIIYNRDRNKSIMDNKRKLVTFNCKDKEHINYLINNIIDDIEGILRFDLEKYFNHYYSVLLDKLDEDIVGPNWALFLEFGTRDVKNIILQNAGFSRYVSNFLIKNYFKYIIFEENILIGIKRDILKIIKEDIVVYNEIINSSYLLD